MYLLSDGQRTISAMIGDLAMRCVQLNPHLGAEAAQKSSGIVLIDEIDLHLHPSWQRRIVADLKTNFPGIQFFATTHSPFIVQSIKGEYLIDLNDRENAGKTFNEELSIEDVSESVMGVDTPQRSKKYNHMMDLAEKMFALKRELNTLEKDTAEFKSGNKILEIIKKQLLDASERFSDDAILTAYLKGV